MVVDEADAVEELGPVVLQARDAELRAHGEVGLVEEQARPVGARDLHRMGEHDLGLVRCVVDVCRINVQVVSGLRWLRNLRHDLTREQRENEKEGAL